MKTLRPLIPLLSLFLLGFTSSASALMINWTDWQSSTTANGFTATGTITSGTEMITVTYENSNGISFFQDGVNGSTNDYWRQGPSGALGRVPATSPYTSTGPNGVDNIPTASEMIALNQAGTQTLSFSQAIANPVFSYVSLNGNGYEFDQDFEILSFGGLGGDIDGNGANDRGYWGFGTSEKNIVMDMMGGATKYQLIGTGEPHGTLRFTGTFDTVTWRSLSSENWNGFTVGVQGTATQVFPCQVNPNLPQCNPNPNAIPEPTTLALLGLSIAGLGFRRKAH